METKNGSGAEVAAAGGTGGQGGSVVQHYNACPMGAQLRDKVTVVLRLDAKKNGSRGGWGGDNVVRYEGSVDGWKSMGVEAGYMTSGAAASTAEVDQYRWVWPTVSAVVGLAMIVFLVLFLVHGCGGEDKASTVPGTTTTTTTTASTFVPAAPPAPPAPAVTILPLQVAKDGRDGRDGQNGATGPAGPQGLQGEKGDTGDVGPAGPVGPQGPQGEPGADGAPGKNGRNGKSVPGTPGEPGAKGDPGVAGAPGSAGPSGPAGKDAGSVTITVIGGAVEADVE